MKTYILSFFLFSCSLLFGQEWESVNSGTDLRLNSISFASSSIGYIGGNDSLLLKTTNGGDTWLPQATTGVIFNFGLKDIIQVDFLDEDIGFLTVGTVDYGGNLYKTIDGGLNWQVEDTWMCAPIKTYNFDENTAIAIGSGCFTGKDIDKKENGEWGSIYRTLSWANDYLFAIDFYNEDYGMVAGDGGIVYRTFNGGLDWDTVETFTNHTFRDLKFVNDSMIYGVVDSLQNSFLISVDSGATWAEHNASLTFFYPHFEALALTSFNEIMAVGNTNLGNNGFLLWGNEDAVFWNYETVDYALHDVTVSDDSVAFAVGDSGLIVRNTQMYLGVEETEPPMNISFYPNPVNDVLTIENDFEEIQQVHIYDLNGRRVLSQGDQFHQLSLSYLKPGIYFLEVIGENDRAQYKLIKQ